MNRSPLKTVLFGFGKIAAGYSKDKVTARYFSYTTHAQVLTEHPAFDWKAVVDPSKEALESADREWKVPLTFTRLEDLVRNYEPEVAVIATPPDARMDIIERVPSLRAVIVEKPMGFSPAEGLDFLERCSARNILVQVNYWRRADDTFRALANGKLEEWTGKPQAVFGVYGNGLLNSGAHIVDLARMLLGEMQSVQAVRGTPPYSSGPIKGDLQMSFNMKIRGGPAVMIQPLRFDHYRENALDIWGEKARLSILQEGLRIILYPKAPNRAMQGEFEVDSDNPECIESTVGKAFFRMYDNLAAALLKGAPLVSPGASALITERILDAVRVSSENGGQSITVAE